MRGIARPVAGARSEPARHRPHRPHAHRRDLARQAVDGDDDAADEILRAHEGLECFFPRQARGQLADRRIALIERRQRLLRPGFFRDRVAYRRLLRFRRRGFDGRPGPGQDGRPPRRLVLLPEVIARAGNRREERYQQPTP
ncbi:hypothetical protein D3C83_04660 [compost metagenome]